MQSLRYPLSAPHDQGEELIPPSYRLIDMRNAPLVILPFLLIICILFAGCTSPVVQPQTVPATPAPVAGFTSQPVQPVPPSQTCSLVPGPTQIVPPDESVSVTVNRNTITENPTITTTFNGGKGLGMVERMNVTVIRSDCVWQPSQIRNNPAMGTSVTFMGTTKTDRVIVVMTMTSGIQYTVIDKDYPFPVGM